MSITPSTVTRSVDLRPLTAIHRLLQALMGWPEPRCHHHPLMTDAAGCRLAKRDATTATLRAMREAGMTSAEVAASAQPPPSIHDAAW